GVLVREERPRAPEAALNLFRDEQRPPLPAQVGQALQELARGHAHSALALDRLHEDGGGAAADDGRGGREVVPGAEPHAGHQRLERRPVLFGPRQGERAHGPPVEAALKGHELRAARGAADAARELHRRFHRLRPRVAEEYLRREGDSGQAVGEGLGRLAVVEVARVNELPRLLADRGRDLAVAITEAVDPDPGREVEIGLAVGVGEASAPAGHDHQVAVIDRQQRAQGSPRRMRLRTNWFAMSSPVVIRVPGKPPVRRALPATTTSRIPAWAASRAIRTFSAMPAVIVPSSISLSAVAASSTATASSPTRTPSTSER